MSDDASECSWGAGLTPRRWSMLHRPRAGAIAASRPSRSATSALADDEVQHLAVLTPSAQDGQVRSSPQAEAGAMKLSKSRLTIGGPKVPVAESNRDSGSSVESRRHRRDWNRLQPRAAHPRTVLAVGYPKNRGRDSRGSRESSLPTLRTRGKLACEPLDRVHAYAVALGLI